MAQLGRTLPLDLGPANGRNRRVSPVPCVLSKVTLWRGNLDRKPYCLPGECSPDAERCLTARVPVALLISRPSHSSPFSILNQCLLMLALWSCGRRDSVVQAQRQIHRAVRAAFT